MKIKLGVIFGGESVEHEVSIISAVQAMYKMDTEKYEIIPIYITKNREWYTGEVLKEIETFQDLDLLKRYCKNVVLYAKDGKFVLQNKKGFKKIVKELDIVFPIVHGTNVEDGVLQGYLQSIGIPFVGVDVYSAAVGQDKIFMKQIFASEKLPIADYVWFYDSEYQDNKDEIIEKVEALGYPVIIKPCTLGSSVGISVAKNRDELKEAIDEAVKYDNRILVEKLIENLMEVNISVLGNYETQQVSAIEQVMPKKDFLTYEDKYLGNGKTKGQKGAPQGSKGMASASRVIPAPIDPDLKAGIEFVATKAFQVLKSSGVVRIDFLIDMDAKKVYINEINSIPGSLSFYLWEPIGKSYSELLDDMINIGIKDYKKRVAKTHSFDSNILKGFTELGGIKGAKGLKK
ncbi:MAG: D-alanine--D-alanine ligase [Firmicutes bacterium]|nr:D-alanine--D-alanine ligase [Bacillota bacterium]